MMRKFLWVWLLFTIPQPASAEIRDLYRSGRAIGMGGAYAAVADDYQSVYLNPAGMRGNRDPGFHYMIADVELSNDTLAQVANSPGLLSSFNIGTLNTLLGSNVYTRAQFSPTFTMTNFGISLLFDQQAAMYSKNTASPNITLGYQTTSGIQLAYGFGLGRSRSRRRRATDLSFGIGAKFMFRRGGYKVLPTTVLLNASSGSALISQVAGNFGLGIGADLGMIYRTSMGKNTSASFAWAWTEIGDMAFDNGDSFQRGNMKLGAAIHYNTKSFDVLLAYDYANMLEPVDFRLRNHIGFELAIPVLRLYGGVNQVYLTYGVGFDLWIFRMHVHSYAQELGTEAFQDGNRRFLLRLDMNFNI